MHNYLTKKDIEFIRENYFCAKRILNSDQVGVKDNPFINFAKSIMSITKNNFPHLYNQFENEPILPDKVINFKQKNSPSYY